MCFGDLTLLIELTPGQEANKAFVKIIFGVKLCRILCVKTDLNNLMYPGYFFSAYKEVYMSFNVINPCTYLLTFPSVYFLQMLEVKTALLFFPLSLSTTFHRLWVV